MTQSIDLYCERVDASFWSEPVNAVTNLAFVVIGLWLLRGPNVAGRVLGVIEILVGLGSLAFHTFATPWAAALDVGFIGVFILAFAYLVPRSLWGFARPLSVLAAAVVLLLVWQMNALAQDLRESMGSFPPGFYVGAWMSLLVYGLITWLKARYLASRWMLTAAMIFPLSLSARELDGPLCQFLPLGTHWLWHLLNSVVLGLCAWSFHAQYTPELVATHSDSAQP
ncbi:MAG: hypothetical protein RLY30_481 [Pseudomonadota bacterium]